MTLINAISNIGGVSVSSKSASLSSISQQSTGQSLNNVSCGNCGGNRTKQLIGVFTIVGAFFNLFGNYFRGSNSCGCGN